MSKKGDEFFKVLSAKSATFIYIFPCNNNIHYSSWFTNTNKIGNGLFSICVQSRQAGGGGGEHLLHHHRIKK